MRIHETLGRAFLRLFFILSLCLVSVGIHAKPQLNHLFSTLSSINESGIGVVDVITQDKLGFMWFGAENGLGRYDGHNLKVYRRNESNPHSLPSNRIREIVFDHDDTMWIATSDGLAKYLPDSDTFQRLDLSSSNSSSPTSKNILSLAVDRQNNLFIGTQYGLTILSNDRVTLDTIYNDPNDTNSLSDDFIRAVYIDSQNRVWVGTNAGGLNLIDPVLKTVERFIHKGTDPDSISGNDVRSILEDRHGRFWVGTYGAGLNLFDPNEGTFKHYLTESNFNGVSRYAVYQIIEDKQDTLWFATDHGGLGFYEEASGSFHFYKHNFYDAKSISSNNVQTVFEDSTGDLWVSSFPGAIDFLDRSSTAFTNYSHSPSDPRSLSDSAVLSFFKGSNGVFWVGTENGLNSFNPDSGQFSPVLRTRADGKRVSYGTVLSIGEDKEGNLLIGTWSSGLYRIKKNSGVVTHYLANSSKQTSISSNYIWSIHLDSEQRLWLGTEDGLNLFDTDKNQFVSYMEDAKNIEAIVDNEVRDILETRNGKLWIATLGGLDQFDSNSGAFTHYKEDITNTDSIKGSRITSLLEDQSGLIWIATQDAGVNIYYPMEDRFENINVSNGLPTNNVSGLIDDAQGNIWLSSPSGLIQIDKGRTEIKHFTENHGLVGSNFKRSATYRDLHGNLYFGSTDGISVFHPAEIKPSLQNHPLHITTIEVVSDQSKEQRLDNPSVDSGITHRSVLHTPNISFDHNTLGFTFEFALLSYRSSQKNGYAYMLEGFEESWRYTTINKASYTNIPAGQYTFVVKAANRDGVWLSSTDSIDVQVAPNPWFSWWAYLLYVLFAILLIWSFWRSQLKRTELQQEKMLNARLVKIDHIKDAILANTSHELRSPLNSIVGISDSLVEGIAGDLNGAAKDYLRVISKSGKRLTSLVDSILDYANLIDDNEKVISRPVDIYALINAVIERYDKKPNVSVVNEVSRSASMILADEERLFQVFSTLVDNALRSTEQGVITISVKERDQTLRVSVCDNAMRLTKEQIEQLFDPFNAIDGIECSPFSGVGLSLAISKHLVELHGGSIDVVSPEGKGNCFISSFPIDRQYTVKNLSTPSLQAHHDKGSTNVAGVSKGRSSHALALDQSLQNELEDLGDYSILIVDDDAVNRLLLANMLNHYGFKTLEAVSGQEAVKAIKDPDCNVDMAIMDVMMPGMTGYETSKIIRKQWSMYELPIIFLTATRLSYSASDGLVAGGNDFATKPVSKYELMPRIINILKMLKAINNRH